MRRPSRESGTCSPILSILHGFIKRLGGSASATIAEIAKRDEAKLKREHGLLETRILIIALEIL